IIVDLDGNDDEQPFKPSLREDRLEKATEYLRNNLEVIKEAICEDLFTILHKVEIMKLTTPEILEYKTSTTSGSNIALHIAAFSGYTEAVIGMVSKNSKFDHIRSDDGYTPLEIALLFITPGQKAVVEYLYSITINMNPTLYCIVSCQTVSSIEYTEIRITQHVWTRFFGSKAVCISKWN
ncbi:hypothetical protein MKX03_031445, partial [Papaver bracteatum]